MDAIEHLPGCDLRHKSRQRCSSWRPPEPQVIPEAESTQFVGSTTKPTSRFGCFILTVIATAVVWIPLGLVAVLILFVTGLYTFDRVGFIDLDYSGYPSYVKAGAPPSAEMIEREHCCGGSADWSGVTQFFYTNDDPFEDVVAHYTAELTNRGFSAGIVEPDRTWLSNEQEVRFTKRGEDSCMSIAPFTENYDLDDGIWPGGRARLRDRLLSHSSPYVVLYWESCLG